jgi:hypothetical protein
MMMMMRRVAGLHIKKQLWNLPMELTKELMKQMHEKQKGRCTGDGEQTDDVTQDVIIDLFSGGESWRHIIESYDYIYLPVDIAKLNAKWCTQD